MALQHYSTGGVGRFRHYHLNEIIDTVIEFQNMLPQLKGLLRTRKRQPQRDLRIGKVTEGQIAPAVLPGETTNPNIRHVVWDRHKLESNAFIPVAPTEDDHSTVGEDPFVQGALVIHPPLALILSTNDQTGQYRPYMFRSASVHAAKITHASAQTNPTYVAITDDGSIEARDVIPFRQFPVPYNRAANGSPCLIIIYDDGTKGITDVRETPKITSCPDQAINDPNAPVGTFSSRRFSDL